MRFFKLSIVLAGITAFAFGCAGSGAGTNNTAVKNAPANAANNAAPATPQATPDEFAAARATFKENCADCHRETGEGGQALFNGKPVKVPDFKKPSAMKAEDEDFVDQITDGSDEMPGFKKKLTPEQIKEQVAFIRKNFQGK